MKYKTKQTTNTRAAFNAWAIATKGGELSRVSVSHYRKACRASFLLNRLNDYADRVAEFDNSQSYTPEKSEKMNKKLEEREKATAEALAPLGVEFLIYSHFYHIKSTKTGREIYIKIE